METKSNPSSLFRSRKNITKGGGFCLVIALHYRGNNPATGYDAKKCEKPVGKKRGGNWGAIAWDERWTNARLQRPHAP